MSADILFGVGMIGLSFVCAAAFLLDCKGSQAMSIINPTPPGPSETTITRAVAVLRCLNHMPRWVDEERCVRIEQASPSGLLVLRIWWDGNVTAHFTPPGQALTNAQRLSDAAESESDPNAALIIGTGKVG
jgi:hypothetical protein